MVLVKQKRIHQAADETNKEAEEDKK